MKFGIADKSWRLILATIKEHSEVQEALLFGSRAMGNYKKGSDVDIALKGKKLNWKVVSDISAELNERLPLPYFFDVVNVDSVEEQGVKDHIDQFGVPIFP